MPLAVCPGYRCHAGQNPAVWGTLQGSGVPETAALHRPGKENLVDASVLETFVDFGAAGSAALTSRIYLRNDQVAEGVKVAGEEGTSASVAVFEMGAAVVGDIMNPDLDKDNLGSGSQTPAKSDDDNDWPVRQLQPPRVIHVARVGDLGMPPST